MEGRKTMTIQEIVRMNSYDKQTLYEAFSIEQAQRKEVTRELNKERTISAGLKYDCKYWQEKWLKYDIRHNVNVIGDKEEAISAYFSSPNRIVFTTKNDGYYACTDEGDHIFIWFANYNHGRWRSEVKEMKELLYRMSESIPDIRWTGEFNVLRNHSKEIETGVWQLVL